LSTYLHQISNAIDFGTPSRKDFIEDARFVVAARRIEDISCVLENRLYVTSTNGAKNKDLLKQLCITVVINCTDDTSNEFFKNDEDYKPVYHTYHLRDEETDSIEILETSIDHAGEIIHNELKNGGCVLVHCVAGISRSPTLVLGYLLRYNMYTLKQALLVLLSVRNFIAPNLRYMTTLIRYEIDLHQMQTVTIEEYILHYLGLVAMYEEGDDAVLNMKRKMLIAKIKPLVEKCADDHGELSFQLVNLKFED
jgi:protein-tyrosine phosphatase